MGPDDADQEEEQKVAEQADEAARLEPKVLYQVARQEGELALGRPVSAPFWSALAAGLSMGLSLLAQALLRAPLVDRPWVDLVSRFGYALGFVLVILGRQQLFTENTLTPVIPLLADFSPRRLGRVARLWAVVFVGNMVGTLLLALVLAKLRVFDPSVEAQLREVSVEAVASGFGAMFVKAIFAGWMIALLVWILPSATSQLVVVTVLTYFIGLGGLAHVVAGATEAFYAVFVGAISLGRCLGGFLLPALLGNIIGGVALVAALNHAQVAASGLPSPPAHTA